MFRLPKLMFFCVCLYFCGCAELGIRPTPAESAYATSTADGKGAIASVNPLATQAGLDAFAAGGNAIDAAVAVAFTLGVVDSHNSGVGGGCFILARLANGEILAIDGREMAPARAARDMFVRNGQAEPQLSKTGALAVGIPGSVAALHQLQSRAGKLRWPELLLPAAELAEKGFAVDKTLAMRLDNTYAAMQAFPETARVFSTAEGTPLLAGDRLVQRDLAGSYRALAQWGPEWFYRGEFASRTGSWMAQNGGIITAADFAGYRTKLRTPVKSEFNGYTIYGFPPPSSGGIHVGQMLNMLSSLAWERQSEADRYHLLAEVMRSAFADRSFWLGDADYVNVPERLLSPAYAQQRASLISLDRAAGQVVHGDPAATAEGLLDKHTTHIAAADSQGNWVAVTTTLNTSFGSKVMVPGTGILLNNQMDDFSAQTGVPNAFGLVGTDANSVAPGKRPLSSMSPTLVMKGQTPVLTLGAAGGPTIISQVLQVLLNHLALQDPIAEALAKPRVHHQWQPDMLFVEPAMDQALRDQLQSRGHTLKEIGGFGGTQAIALENGVLVPVTEPRIIERNAQAQ